MAERACGLLIILIGLILGLSSLAATAELGPWLRVGSGLLVFLSIFILAAGLSALIDGPEARWIRRLEDGPAVEE